MDFDLSNTTRSRLRALESINVERGLIFLKIVSIPTFMNACIYRPQISKRGSIVRSLEDKIVNERCLIGKMVDKELDFIEHTNMVLFVLDLEVAIAAR